jgi:D-alanyl-D-alanine carboxypeptidase (penicillin-binding protein 5/6)
MRLKGDLAAGAAILGIVILGIVLSGAGDRADAPAGAEAVTSGSQSLSDCVDCLAEVELVAPTATPEPTPTATPAPAAAYDSIPIEVEASAFAVMEAPCGALLFGEDEHLPLPPASLTKIVTALTAIGRVDLSEKVEVTVSASELQQRTRSSVMGLEPGMEVSVEDLFYGLLLPSGNDAAIALAEHVTGDVETFVRLMNEEAGRLGMHNSSFSNPHGLGSRGMRSTAYDMALAGMAMMRDPTLAAMSGAFSYTGSTGLRLTNGNQLLGTYAGSYGVKIGYTRSASHTIVAAAARDGRDIYVAVLGSDDLYAETVSLLDWAFASTEPQCAESPTRG